MHRRRSLSIRGRCGHERETWTRRWGGEGGSQLCGPQPPKPVGCFVFTTAGFGGGGVEVSEAVASPLILNGLDLAPRLEPADG